MARYTGTVVSVAVELVSIIPGGRCHEKHGTCVFPDIGLVVLLLSALDKQEKLIPHSDFLISYMYEAGIGDNNLVLPLLH